MNAQLVNWNSETHVSLLEPQSCALLTKENQIYYSRINAPGLGLSHIAVSGRFFYYPKDGLLSKDVS